MFSRLSRPQLFRPIAAFQLFAMLFVMAFGVLSIPQPAAAITCSSSALAQNNITVVPSHGSVFYIDTGVTPNLNAGYIGYRVTNSTGSTQSNLWAEVSGFTGGNLDLNNAADSIMKLASITNGSTKTAYFMLKATGATSVAQSHTLKIYDNRPDLAGATVLYECDFSFTRIKETIKAAANKLADNGLTSAAAIEVSDTSPSLGELITVTVEGQTGQIGAGSTPDFDMIWLTPAAIASWPTRALRLESVSITFDGNGNWTGTADQVTYTDRLLITGTNGLINVDNSEYRITYSFRVIGQPQTTVKAVPVAQIASGTQIKHSDTGATGGTLDITFSPIAIDASLVKSVTATTSLTVVTCGGSCVVPSGVNGETYVAVPYRLTATTTQATTLTLDEFVDLPASELIFDPGSATITDIGRTAVAIDDPTYVASEISDDPRPNHFIGPFTFNASTNAYIDYTMWVPVGSYANTAYAKLGDILIGANSSAQSRVTVSSDGSGTVIAVTDTLDFNISAVTGSASDVASTTATISGTVDPNGTTPLTGTFQYGTDPNLVGATTVTATTPGSGTLSGLTDPTNVSVGLTGLSPATTYYYRVVAGSVLADIRSFSTLAVLADPTPTTQAATSVGQTTATLNGTINPNLTTVTGVQFIYGTSPTLASGNTTSTQDDGTGLAALTLGGSSLQPFTQDLTSLTSGTTYYFKIRACTSALTGTYPNVSCSTFFDGSILNFTATAITAPTVTTNAATSTATSTATINGAITATGGSDATQSGFAYSLSPTLDTVIATSTLGAQTGTASFSQDLSGLTPNTTYYFRAYATNSGGTGYGTIQSFTTSALTAPTVTTQAASSVAATTATANGTITSIGNDIPTVRGFIYGLTTSYGATTTESGSFSTGAFTASLSSLTCNTTYHLKAYATNGAGTAFGSDESFTTSACAPTVTTNAATSVATSTATINGAITATGGADATESGFAYGTSPTLSTVIATSTLGAQTGTASFSQDLSSLTPNTTYYFRAYAINSAGTSFGSILSFTTSALTAPTVTTQAASSVAATTATANGTITSIGNTPTTVRGFIYGLTTSYGATTTESGTFSTGAFTASLSSLTCNTTYHLKAYATNGAGTSFGADESFTTSACVPTVTTDAATSVATSTATINGAITATGGADATESGFAYGTSPTLSTVIATSTLGAQTGTASFSQDLSGLTPNTTYYFRAYAINSAGTSFGSILSFTTDSVTAPTVTTQAASSVAATTATANGTITSTGNTPPTVRGFIYGLTTSYGATTTESGTFSTGAFTGSISGLTCNTTYHVKGYATNAAGTSYGSDESFTTTACVPIVSTDSASAVTSVAATLTGSVTDTGGGTIVTRGFIYGLLTTYGATTTESGSFSTGSFTTDVSSLVCDTLYHFNAYAITSAGISYGSDQTLVTDACASPGGGGSGSSGAGSSSNGSFGQNILLTPVPNASGQDSNSSDASSSSDESSSSDAAPDTCNLDCASITYDLYIVNPDGSERHMDSNYARVDQLGNGVVRVNFEDSGKDFDYNDVLVRVDRSACEHIIATVVTVDAAWHHQVRLALKRGGQTLTDVLLANDSQTSVGANLTLDFNDHQNSLCLPEVGECAVDCNLLDYRVYMIIPDGTKRLTNSRYVQASSPSVGVTRYAFEDKGDDFDYNDAVIVVNKQNCSAVTFTVESINAGWDHQIGVQLYYHGQLLKDDIVFTSTQKNVGQSVAFDYTADQALCTPIVSLPQSEGVELYEHINYLGKKIFIEKGANIANLAADAFDNFVSSLKLIGLVTVKAFTEPQFAGLSEIFTVNDADLRDNSIANDTVSSLQVIGDVVGEQQVQQCTISTRFTSVVQSGSTGDSVLRLQRLLQCLGYFSSAVEPDGNFGDVTRQAVIDFQVSKGIDPVGIVGPITRAALNLYYVGN